MPARILTALAMGVLLGTASQGGAQSEPGTGLTLRPESRLWVEGTSTVRSFSCKATTVTAALETTSSRAVSATLAGEKVVRSVRLEVPARALDCDNGTMNGHMYKAIKADAHPAIVFNLSSYDLQASGGAPGRAILTGSLLLGGQEKPITLNVDLKESAEGWLQVSGTHEVRLSDFGLKPPSLMLGTMKVGEAVQVNYELFLKH